MSDQGAIVMFIVLVVAVVLVLLLRSSSQAPKPASRPHGILRRVPVRRTHPATTSAPSSGQCLGCRGPLESIGVERFRVGGSTGGWKLVFGEWAELGEGMIDMEVLGCPQCRRVELRVPSARPG